MQKSGMYEVYGKSTYNADEEKGESFLIGELDDIVYTDSL